MYLLLSYYLSFHDLLSIDLYISFFYQSMFLSFYLDIHISSIIIYLFSRLTHHLSICMRPDETFLEDISMILTTGEVPNLFTHDEKANILERVQVGYRFLYEPKILNEFLWNYLFLFLWYALVFTGGSRKIVYFHNLLTPVSKPCDLSQETYTISYLRS